MLIKSRQKKQKEREEIVVKRMVELMEKLQEGEINGKELNYEIEELLFDVRTGKI